MPDKQNPANRIEQKKPMGVPIKGKWAAVLAGFVLIGYIGFLLITNFMSQAEIRQSTFERFLQDMEYRSDAVGYFLSERVNDIKALAAGNELNFFFTNKALGMSMNYGLSANLHDITASFDRLVSEKKLGGDFIYDRIDFISADESIHVHHSREERFTRDRSQLEPFFSPESEDVEFSLVETENIHSIAISMPYVFKNKTIGQIITWISVTTVYENLVHGVKTDSNRNVFLAYKSGYLCPPFNSIDELSQANLPELEAIPTKEIFQFEGNNLNGSVSDMLAFKVWVQKTPFSLVAVMPHKALFGQTELWRLFLLLAIVSIGVMIAIVTLLKFKDQNLILNVRLHESKKNQKDATRKNEQLQAEIAERKEYEIALKSSEKKFRRLYMGMQDGLVCTDMNGFILESNAAFLKMIGCSDKEIHGSKLNAFSSKEDVWNSSETMQTQISGRGFSDIYEEILTRKDGTVFPAEFKTFRLADKNGLETKIWTIIRDVSDRKRSEGLRNAKKMADAANKAKSDFLANMSHELRTPLNHIIGFTQLVVDKIFGELNADQEEHLNDALQSSNHLLSLINDILDISKIEAGKLELEPREVFLESLLENSMVMVKEKAIKQNITMKTNLDDTPETIIADERKIKQIVYNLLSNAVKFTPEGGGIRLSACMKTCNNGCIVSPSGKMIEWPSSDAEAKTILLRKYIEIGVKDTGIGINPEDLDRVFDPFEQTQTPDSMKYQGTGLGLSLSKSLVELHGGKIWVESGGHDAGSTFYFVIPLQTP